MTQVAISTTMEIAEVPAEKLEQLKKDAVRLLSELGPVVRTTNDCDLLVFYRYRLNYLIENKGWTIHDRSLVSDLIACRHVLVIRLNLLQHPPSGTQFELF